MTKDRKERKPHPMYSVSKLDGKNIMLTPAERRKARKRYLKWKHPNKYGHIKL